MSFVPEEYQAILDHNELVYKHVPRIRLGVLRFVVRVGFTAGMVFVAWVYHWQWFTIPGIVLGVLLDVAYWLSHKDIPGGWL